mgnify:CR=1 FL=1
MCPLNSFMVTLWLWSTSHSTLKNVSNYKHQRLLACKAGDILYLPPHFAHHGVALDDCMTFSIGFRAPKQVEILDALVNILLEKDLGKRHYSDSDLQLTEYEYEINSQSISRLKQLLHDAVDEAEPLLANAFGKLVTETKPCLYELASEQFSELPSVDELDKQFSQGHYLQKNSYLRFAWSQDKVLYIAGEAYELADSDIELVCLLAENDNLRQPQWHQIKSDSVVRDLLCQFIAEGVWLWKIRE